MRGYCPNCGKEVSLKTIQREEVYPVKGKEITVNATICVCEECQNEVWNMEIDDDNLIQAYEVYRKQRGLLLPKEIKVIREQYGLSQVAFAKVLGVGEKSIARYENGSLQDEAQNNLILLVKDPKVFLILFNKNKLKLTVEEIKQVQSKIQYQSMLGQTITYPNNIFYIYPKQNDNSYNICEC